MVIPSDVIDYWFGTDYQDGFTVENKNKLWFMGGEEVDKEITQRFAGALQLAESDQLQAWQQTAEGCMALIILLDQFSRNIYRGTAKAFANDAKALELAKALVEKDLWTTLPLIQRVFILLPYEHSEAIQDQDECLKLMDLMISQAGEKQQERLTGFRHHVLEHRAIIQQFGRFPHRNRVLDRQTTQEEQAYLDGTGKTFGQ